MEKVYVSLGSNCSVAHQLIKTGKRFVSFPLDWIFTYHSLYKLFENDFKDFLKIETKPITLTLWNDGTKQYPPIEFNKDYSTIFLHREKEIDEVYENVIQRRVNRLLELLRSQEKEIVFIRRGHFRHYHSIIPHLGFTPYEQVINDKEEMELLVKVLRKKYPQLKFKIYLFYNCRCKVFKDCDTEYLKTKHLPVSGSKPENDYLLKQEIELL